MSSRTFAIIAAIWTSAVVGTATAETVLFDFETEAERTTVTVGRRWGYSVSVTNRYAASGDWAVRFECPPWRKGVADWPSCKFRPAVTNWTGYDRLIVEVVSLRDAPPDANGDGGGSLMLCLAGPTGPVKRGLEVHLQTPTCGYRQWVVPLKWPKPRKGMASLAENVARVHFFTVAKNHRDGHEFYIDRLALLKKGEPLPVPQGPCVMRDILPLESAAKMEFASSNAALHAEISHREDYERFCRDALLSSSRSPDMALGWATPMEKIMPRGRFTAKPVPEGGLKVRLARNEREAVQLLVAPLGHDLTNVRVRVDGDLKPVSTPAGKMPAPPGTVKLSNRQTGEASNSFAATNIFCSPVGYVDAKNEAPYRVGYEAPSDDAPGYRRKTRIPPKGWWPDPILDFLDGVVVAGTDVQSFWIDVRCPEDQAAGEYAGTLVVSADGVAPVRVPLSVRVNGFAVPRASPLPLAITFCPDYALGTNSPAPRAVITGRLTEWCDFLADHYVTIDDIYMPGNGRNTIHFDMLERLRDQGRLGLFNLGHWNLPKSTNETDMAVWRKRWIEPLKKAYEEAKRRNLLGHAYSYGCDEVGIKSFSLVRAAAEEVRSAVPGIPLSTTSYDDDFGVGTNRLLDVIDWFTPSTMKFNPAKVALSRAEGHQVWWYICVGPQAPFANMFLECPAIEGRILMGAQTVRMRPDGFLYYFINLWPRTNRCIEGGPFTDWNPRSYGTTHGDGSWVCPGPGGRPLSTIRFENFRDGLEDYAYAKLLEEKLRMRGNGELGRGEWIRRAKAALAVPGEVVDERPYPAEGLDPEYWRNCPVMYSMTNFTDDPVALYRWRDEMADLIEEASRK